MAAPDDLRVVGDQIEEGLAHLAKVLDPPALEDVQDVIALVTRLYGGGLARILELAGEDPALRERLVEDDLVASLLAIHDLHPLGAAALPTSTPVAITRKRPRPEKACDLCAEPVADAHEHVVDLEARALRCTCRGCWLLFTSDGAGGGRYRAVPDRYVAISGAAIDPGTWDELQIPVSVAFFLRSSTTGSVAALYPSPAGATESLLPLDAWERLAADHEVLRTMQADVEALLVRVDQDATQAFVVPIDACYELVGVVRQRWKGLDGGSEARAAIDALFTRIEERAR